MVLPPACMARPCSHNDRSLSHHLAEWRKLLLLLDILVVLRFLAAALLDRLGIVSCHDTELPGEPWCDQYVDTAAMERLMEGALIRTSRYYRLRRSRTSSPGGGDGGAAICTICLAELEAPEGGGYRPVVAELSGCSHAFHAACIDGWVGEAGTSCPLCRTPVLPPY